MTEHAFPIGIAGETVLSFLPAGETVLAFHPAGETAPAAHAAAHHLAGERGDLLAVYIHCAAGKACAAVVIERGSGVNRDGAAGDDDVTVGVNSVGVSNLFLSLVSLKVKSFLDLFRYKHADLILNSALQYHLLFLKIE